MSGPLDHHLARPSPGLEAFAAGGHSAFTALPTNASRANRWVQYGAMVPFGGGGTNVRTMPTCHICLHLRVTKNKINPWKISFQDIANMKLIENVFVSSLHVSF